MNAIGLSISNTIKLNRSGPYVSASFLTTMPSWLTYSRAGGAMMVNSVLAGGVSGSPGTQPTSWSQFTTGASAVTYSGTSVRVLNTGSDRWQIVNHSPSTIRT